MAARSLVQAHRDSGIPLRIKVNQQHALLHRGERCGEVYGGRGFAHAAFLIRYRYNLHSFTFWSAEWTAAGKANPARALRHLAALSIQSRAATHLPLQPLILSSWQTACLDRAIYALFFR